MSTFSKVLHAGEEAISVSGSDEYIFIAMSRQGMRLSHEEADELVEALTHGRTRSDGFTAADMMDARADVREPEREKYVKLVVAANELVSAATHYLDAEYHDQDRESRTAYSDRRAREKRMLRTALSIVSGELA